MKHIFLTALVPVPGEPEFVPSDALHKLLETFPTSSYLTVDMVRGGEMSSSLMPYPTKKRIEQEGMPGEKDDAPFDIFGECEHCKDAAEWRARRRARNGERFAVQ